MPDSNDVPLDDDGQPPGLLNASWRRERSVDEMLGFLRGILVAGPLSEQEVIALARMINERAEDLDLSMFGELASDLAEAIHDDGRVSEASRAVIEKRARQILGMSHGDVVTAHSSALPLTVPVPKVVFPGRVFCFTGKFAFGPRKTCEAAVVERGGRTMESVTTETDYLVVGSLASRDWVHSAYGRKIERALDLSQRHPIALISEETFTNGLRDEPLENTMNVESPRKQTFNPICQPQIRVPRRQNYEPERSADYPSNRMVIRLDDLLSEEDRQRIVEEERSRAQQSSITKEREGSGCFQVFAVVAIILVAIFIVILVASR